MTRDCPLPNGNARATLLNFSLRSIRLGRKRNQHHKAYRVGILLYCPHNTTLHIEATRHIGTIRMSAGGALISAIPFVAAGKRTSQQVRVAPQAVMLELPTFERPMRLAKDEVCYLKAVA